MYALYAASMLVGITGIVAIILNYIKLDEVRGTLAESHFRWQIRTFWFSLLWYAIGVFLIFTFVGIIIAVPLLLGASIWWIYRIVRGFVNLNDGRPMYA